MADRTASPVSSSYVLGHGVREIVIGVIGMLQNKTLPRRGDGRENRRLVGSLVCIQTVGQKVGE